jgi:large subunit ribosomal protein L18
MNSIEKSRQLARRQQRVRQRIFGTDERPRLNVYRSSGHIYAQIINDIKGTTLVSASSLDKSLRNTLKSTSSVVAAKAVGTLLAERSKNAKIQKVVFDRAGRLYHGRIKALAEASREGGLQF